MTKLKNLPIILLFILLQFGGYNLWAQSTLGFKLGVGNNIHFTKTESSGAIFGFTDFYNPQGGSFQAGLSLKAGITFDHFFKNNIGIGTDLLVQYNRAKGDFDLLINLGDDPTNVLDLSGERLSNLYYIQIPVFFQYKYPFQADKAFLNLEIGPYIGIGIGGKVEDEVSIGIPGIIPGLKLTDNNSQDAFNLDFYERIDFGAQFGLVINFKQWYIGLDNSLSFKNLINEIPQAVSISEELFPIDFEEVLGSSLGEGFLSPGIQKMTALRSSVTFGYTFMLKNKGQRVDGTFEP